jgi:hypothetical protein
MLYIAVALKHVKMFSHTLLADAQVARQLVCIHAPARS